ncbi:AraC family transcriptional regulator [Flammeovirga pacifica]|uniref:HTH araC/xylS-type domain-containing protein n=1 Tax=Flammeovirga pacifica TaxID=915059 RepID=A0A1S1Z3W6_FLAPC|nr:AraC family transcriptional regulator [Flammeovirga pacifica]OHX67853.1 hypothetical protein NH26_16670 [Flammeovirga pacifica]
MVDTTTDLSFKFFLEKHSRIISQKEEFGLDLLKASSKSTNRKGNYQKISFANLVLHQFSWNIQTPITILLPCEQQGIFFQLSPNCNIVNHQKIGENTGFIVNGEDIELTLVPNQNYFIFIEFKQEYFEQKLLHPSLKQMVMDLFLQKSPTFRINKELSILLEKLTSTQKRGLCQLMYLNGKLFEVLSEISDQITNYENNQQHQYEPQMSKVKQLIDENLHIQYSINELAKSVGINTSYLKKHFKAIYEETVFEYATRKRMDYAKNLLKTTHLSISIISEKVGYQHSAHFSYAFKKNMDLTPNQYRRGLSK